MDGESFRSNNFRKLLTDMLVMRLPELMKKFVRKFHLVGPDISSSYFIARSVDLRIVFRKTLEGVEQMDVVKVKDVAHGLAKKSRRPAAQNPKFHNVARDAAERHIFKSTFVRVLMNFSSSLSIVENKAHFR